MGTPPAGYGHGYATAAAAAVLGATAACGFGRWWATVGIWNTASQRVLGKPGFRRHGLTRDEYGEPARLTRTITHPCRPNRGHPGQARLQRRKAAAAGADPAAGERRGLRRPAPGGRAPGNRCGPCPLRPPRR
ncbi:GNAT family N-acetyltransferase [Streptomonospora sp. PA3]|uniref:GNAT family N-acetyltransferase n=1 Tax=Streptomonospora sp. PA3 TaxID=2607326 RepID=UPI003742529E